ncbi:MAG: Gfo/Idh/MocA family oxidoreductase [Clostridia bacterium]|nr:Gfo/Idh/MocA family oxidoreductase [Clostridia bacterium]
MDKIKLGVVGMRRGSHLAEIALETRSDKVELCVICDKNTELLQRQKDMFEKKYGICNLRATASFDELLNTDIDTVIIATDATIHTPMAIDALKCGKHVISEIPAIFTLEEARMLKNATDACPNQKYMFAENCCFWYFINKWKEIYEQGMLGEVWYAESEYLHSLGTPKNPDGTPHWRTSYDAIRYVTHNLGVLLYILGDKCVQASGFAPDINPVEGHTGTPNELGIFKTEKGALIKIFCAFGIERPLLHNFSLYGSKGTLETDRSRMTGDGTLAAFGPMKDLKTMTKIPFSMQYPGCTINDGHGGADAKMMEAFIDSLIQDTNPPIDVDMAIAMSIPGIYAHMSKQQGGIPLDIVY